MDNIKNKIVKLLALSESSNANEAKAALLKARELMAEHKLNLTDVVPEKQPVVRATIGIFCTKMTDQWAVYLNEIIATHYWCVAYRHIHHKGDKHAELGLIGLKDDFEICKRIMLYAFESIQSRCTEFKRNGMKSGDSGRDRCPQREFPVPLPPALLPLTPPPVRSRERSQVLFPRGAPVLPPLRGYLCRYRSPAPQCRR